MGQANTKGTCRMLAIHTKSSPGSFVPGWIQYCEENSIPYREVDCLASDIIEQVKGCEALLWNWPHYDIRSQLFARQLVQAIEEMGITVFPSTKTCWHYDDKVGQKYLLEAVGAPIVPTHVFYDKDRALSWVDETSFPKVWKLRGGAGSENVRLVRTKQEARRIIIRSFNQGWSNSRYHELKDRFLRFRRNRTLQSLKGIARSMSRIIVPSDYVAKGPRQRQYVYFQDFIPDNDCDIRVIVIGNRAFGFKRMVREGDFRASGGGINLYDDELPKECIQIAFDVTTSLQSQCCAFDFVQRGQEWLVIEISYAFSVDYYKRCPGFWCRNLNWHEVPVMPEQFMMEDLLDYR